MDLKGNILGQHKGIIHYTVGQRKGLGIAFGVPKYVYGIDPERNEVILCDNEELFSKTVKVSDFHWINRKPDHAVRCKAKVRYRHTEKWAVAEPISDSEVIIVFDEGERAITPGQAAVLYDGDIVLGGGTIEKT